MTFAGYLASPQLSVPGTPTDYTAFSAVMPSNVLLCNTNSVFSPIMDDFENRDSTGTLDLFISLQNLLTSPHQEYQKHRLGRSSVSTTQWAVLVGR